jgi:outer membrane immunogenic protein
MKKLLLISATLGALIGPASAADLARPVYRRPVVVAAPIYTWTGFYVGGNVGYSSGHARTDIAGTATTFFFPPVFANPSNFAFAGSNTAALQGVIGGGQVGYNHQFSPRWVLGFEADIQGSGERGSSAFVNPFSGPLCVNAIAPPPVCTFNFDLKGTAATSYEAKIEWFGTVRGRLGFLVNDQVLIYGTGGLAYGWVKLSGVTNVNGFAVNPIDQSVFTFAAPGTSVFGASNIRAGFAVGGGIEGKCSYLLPAGWTWKLEYLYVDLGSFDTVSPFPPGNPTLPTAPETPFSGPMTTHTRFTDNIVRVGLNYKFGYAAAPVYK